MRHSTPLDTSPPAQTQRRCGWSSWPPGEDFVPTCRPVTAATCPKELASESARSRTHRAGRRKLLGRSPGSGGRHPWSRRRATSCRLASTPTTWPRSRPGSSDSAVAAGCREWSNAISEPVMGAPVRLLCQMAVAIARTRRATRIATPSKVRPPCCSRSSCPLRVSLTDSMSRRTFLSIGSPNRCFSRLNDGRSNSMPSSASSSSNAFEANGRRPAAWADDRARGIRGRRRLCRSQVRPERSTSTPSDHCAAQLPAPASPVSTTGDPTSARAARDLRRSRVTPTRFSQRSRPSYRAGNG